MSDRFFGDKIRQLEEKSVIGLAVFPPANQSISADKVCHFKKIHSALLGQIFEEALIMDRLRIELVSKQFERAAKRYGWTSQHLYLFSCDEEKFKTFDNVDEHIISLLCRAGPILRYLHFRTLKYNVHIDGSLFAYFRLTPNITVLNINNVNLEPSHLDVIAEHLSPKLKEVCFSFDDLFRVYIRNPPLNYIDAKQRIKAAFQRFLVACTKLEVLIFAYEHIDPAFFNIFPRTLRALKLSSLDICNDAIISIGNLCADRLETLVIESSLDEITKSLNVTLPKFTKLKTLLLYTLRANIGRMSPSCFGPTLQHLYIDVRRTISDDTFCSITNVCQSIQTLELRNSYSLTAEGLQSLAKFPKLVKLRLISVKNLSNDTLKAIARRGKLKSLQISSNLSGASHFIDASTIHELIDCCKSLIYLNISKWPPNCSLAALNAEMERRYGVGTQPSTRREMEKQRFRLVCGGKNISKLEKKNASKWIKVEKKS